MLSEREITVNESMEWREKTNRHTHIVMNIDTDTDTDTEIVLMLPN